MLYNATRYNYNNYLQHINLLNLDSNYLDYIDSYIHGENFTVLIT